MEKKIWIKKVILSLILIPLLFGCSGKKGLKTIQGDPETLYKQGLIRFNKRDYPEALKKFEQLKSNFPDSPPYTVWAELKAADCHFLRKEYVEAIAAYEEFKKVHPTYEEIPYVQYQIGLSYFNQMLTLDRDQTFTKKALSNFEYLIANYPPSLFTEKAKEKVDVCKKRLADHEFYIANFYYKHGKFQAAVSRFEGLLKTFPKGPEEDKTLYLLGKSYLELDQWEKAREAFIKMVNEYPSSSHSHEVKAILDQRMNSKNPSLRKTKGKEPKKEEGQVTGGGKAEIILVKFEEEGRKPVSLKEGKEIEVKGVEEKIAFLPVAHESFKQISPEEKIDEKKNHSAEDQMKIELKPEDEKRIAILPNTLTIPREEGNPPKGGNPKKEGNPQKEVLSEPKPVGLVDTDHPIDITSDRVETYSKENLIFFKGNVTARQKDLVIYADSLEAVIIENGKGIEKVIAEGNVKIQQGLRVANCKKAVFDNIGKKVILTGDPKVWEGDNMVSGDEIIFDLEQDRVDVKGGAGGRGKAKISR
jgi:outer membrane protein assembly factor BamD